MALHQINLWTVSSRENSSLDYVNANGGLERGTLTLPRRAVSSSKGIRIFTTKDSDVPEDFASLQLFLTGIGGAQTSGINGETVTIEFDTRLTAGGKRGILRVEALVPRTFHYSDPLTKGEAMRYMMTHGVDEYNWDGEKAIASGGQEQLTVLPYSTDVAAGSSTIQNGNVVILPPSQLCRGVFVTVLLTREYDDDGIHDIRMRVCEADGTTVIQEIPSEVRETGDTKSSFTFPLYTYGLDDDYSHAGFRLVLLNDAQTVMRLKAVKIIVQTLSNPDFTQI